MDDEIEEGTRERNVVEWIEEEEEGSEHGSTTDNENEVIYYWERLKDGVLGYPAPLKLQCLMFIIGHILDQIYGSLISISSLSLLPRSIRYQLLLLLPAIDVCKLEGTSVTRDILMDEIWERIYKERMPSSSHKRKLKKCGFDICTPQEMLEEKGIIVSWKEAYFNTIFSLKQFQHTYGYEFHKCECVYGHFLPDLFYGIYNDDENELFKCFGSKTLSVHNICRSTHKCPHVIPARYERCFEDVSISPRAVHKLKACWRIPYATVIDLLVNTCHVSVKHLSVSSFHFQEMWEDNYVKLRRKVTKPLLDKCLSNIESITIIRCSEDRDVPQIQTILDTIFIDNSCHIKSVLIIDRSHSMCNSSTSSLDMIHPYLMKGPNCNLKQLQVRLKHESSQSLETLTSILQHHQELETVELYLIYDQSINYATKFFECTSNLLYRPVFKKLALHYTNYATRNSIPFDILLNILRLFFATPYPVRLSLELSCPQFDALPEMLPVNTEQVNKSLEFKDCLFSSNFVSLLSRNIVMESFAIYANDFTIISSFANLESIKVKKFTLHTYCYISDDIMADMCKLFSIVTADEWNLSTNINESNPNYVSIYADELAKIGSNLSCFTFDRSNIHMPILETIFNSLSSKREPYFELGLPCRYLDDNICKSISLMWEKCGAVKTKCIKVFTDDQRHMQDFFDSVVEILSIMTLEVIIV